MKVFVSWSGDHARDIAQALREWLPSVIQSTEVFVSANDIGAGERWLNRVNGALDQIDFGVVVLTEENKDRPWINFETGALAKHLERARVVPLLCNISILDIAGSPLNQFQCVSLSREGLRLVATAIYEGRADDEALSQANFERAFDTWWPELESQLAEIDEEYKKVKPKAVKPTEGQRLDNIERAVTDILSTVKGLQSRSGQGGTSRKVTPDEFFSLPESEAASSIITAAALAESAETKEQIQRAMEYIKRRKPPTLQKKFLPRLEAKLGRLE